MTTTNPDQPIRKQVADEYTKRQKEADIDGGDPQNLSLDDSVQLILDFTETYPAMIVIDALDECDLVLRSSLIQALDEIVTRSTNLIKVFISSRDEQDIVFRLEHSPNVYINAADNGHDIGRFVHEKVEEAIHRGLLLHGNVTEALKSRIVSTLIRGAQGMQVSQRDLLVL